MPTEEQKKIHQPITAWAYTGYLYSDWLKARVRLAPFKDTYEQKKGEKKKSITIRCC